MMNDQGNCFSQHGNAQTGSLSGLFGKQKEVMVSKKMMSKEFKDKRSEKQ